MGPACDDAGRRCDGRRRAVGTPGRAAHRGFKVKPESLTRTLVAASLQMGVRLVDHIVIGGAAHASSLQKGLIRTASSYGDVA